MNSIRVRLLVGLMATLLLVAALMALVTYRNVLAQTEALFDYQLRQMALSLRDQGEIAPSQADALADALADGQLDFVVQIWTVDGRSIYASRAHATLPERAVLGLADITVRGQTWRTFGVVTRDRVIQVAQPLQRRRDLAADAALHSVAPMLLLAPLLALAVWWLAALTLAPLRRVAEGLRQRDEQSLAAVPMQGLPDEVVPLVSALNGLLQRLGSTLQAQRAFVADAAHELRSPLTALTIQLQLLRRAGDDASRTLAIDALAAGIERAARLVEQLLTLARNEPGAPATMVDGLDLTAIARAAVVETAPLAQVRASALALLDGAPVLVRGDAAALAVLARNLVDNAVRYSPAGARVQVRSFFDGEAAVLQVDDAGRGIPASDRERVFDRFYRHSGGDEPGTGLGLAIVRSIATRHGANVVLGDSPLGGLRATVRFAAG